MAVSFGSQSTNQVISEYAASAITFVRQIQNINGEMVPSFSGNIAYEKKTYILDSNGKKIGVVSQSDSGAMNSENTGNIYLDPTKLSKYFSEKPSDKILGEVIADMADGLIEEDLVNRGILKKS